MKIKLILIFIFLFGFILRIWRVGNYPPLLWDEASLGYNAYSIIQTGRDEYGKFLPLVFKSFGDYKPGFYIYLAAPFIKVFGLNEFAVRLPSVILGALTPLVLFCLLKELFDNQKLAIASAIVLALLPWHIHFSRGAWEANVMVFLLTLGSWLAIRKFKIKSFRLKRGNILERFLNLWGIILLPFLFALWTYQGAKMLVPLFLIALLVFNVEKIAILERETIVEKIIAILVFGLIGFWYFQTFSGQMSNRLKVMSLFSFRQPKEEKELILKEDNLISQDFHAFLFHGEWLFFLRGFLGRYFNHFSPRFLAFEGDWNNSRHSAPYFGTIGHVNFVLLVFGLFLFLSRKRKVSEHFLTYWLLIAPVPSALSRDIISGIRALPMVIPISFFVGYGLYEFLKLKLPIQKFSKILKKLILTFFSVLFFIDFIYWSDLYFVHMIKRSAKEWLYGYKESIKFVLDKKDSSKKVLFTDFYGQPYIYYLFYSQYDPFLYQQDLHLKDNIYGDVGRVERIDKILFKSVDWQADRETNDLIIISQDEIFRQNLDKDLVVMKEFTPLGVINSQGMFYGYEKR